MIEDVNAQAHQLLDTLTFADCQVALAMLQSLSSAQSGQGSFTSLVGVEIVDMKRGRAVGRLEIRQHLLNTLGIMHGGAGYTLADVTTGAAATTLLENNQLIVTQDLHYRYHGMARHGSLEAHAEVIHKGSRTIVVQCKITQDGRLIGSADGTFALITGRDLLDPQATHKLDGKN